MSSSSPQEGDLRRGLSQEAGPVAGVRITEWTLSRPHQLFSRNGRPATGPLHVLNR